MKTTTRKILAMTLSLTLLCCLAGTLAGCAKRGPNLSELQPPPGYPVGVYVDVYESTDFKGASARLWGPAIFNNLASAQGQPNWSGKIQSISVGPQALVKITDQKNLQGNVLWLKSDQKVEDLSKFNFANKTASLEIVSKENKD